MWSDDYGEYAILCMVKKAIVSNEIPALKYINGYFFRNDWMPLALLINIPSIGPQVNEAIRLVIGLLFFDYTNSSSTMFNKLVTIGMIICSKKYDSWVGNQLGLILENYFIGLSWLWLRNLDVDQTKLSAFLYMVRRVWSILKDDNYLADPSDDLLLSKMILMSMVRGPILGDDKILSDYKLLVHSKAISFIEQLFPQGPPEI